MNTLHQKQNTIEIHVYMSCYNYASSVRRVRVPGIETCTECSLNIVFFPQIYNILWPRVRPHWATICCTVNGQPIRVTVHSDLRSDELLSYMQGMGCSELEKNSIFNEHPVYN